MVTTGLLSKKRIFFISGFVERCKLIAKEAPGRGRMDQRIRKIIPLGLFPGAF
jgi:hypothetical protein